MKTASPRFCSNVQGSTSAKKTKEVIRTTAVYFILQDLATQVQGSFLLYSSFSCFLCLSFKKRVWSWIGWMTWKKYISNSHLSQIWIWCIETSNDTYRLYRKIIYVAKFLLVLLQVLNQLRNIWPAKDVLNSFTMAGHSGEIL